MNFLLTALNQAVDPSLEPAQAALDLEEQLNNRNEWKLKAKVAGVSFALISKYLNDLIDRYGNHAKQNNF